MVKFTLFISILILSFNSTAQEVESDIPTMKEFEQHQANLKKRSKELDKKYKPLPPSKYMVNTKKHMNIVYRLWIATPTGPESTFNFKKIPKENGYMFIYQDHGGIKENGSGRYVIKCNFEKVEHCKRILSGPAGYEAVRGNLLLKQEGVTELVSSSGLMFTLPVLVVTGTWKD